ncbi:hypothetical protein [Pelagibaculum spongiae]|uniref:Uncharacterized protein n=1 Tax=Pelagibaculum spongiae TaxID=2080658 RepID=A0A2V1GY95_9GAMM|nr:hypothetical protein [Pelagibaculum spongiae]PVZ72081.1 hypothetical protein DC094_03420 [Pelagibaculum spongiae]
MKKWLVIGLVLFGFYQWWNSREVLHAPGVLVAESPYQQSTSVQPFQFKSYQIAPLAEFSLSARVLSRENYSLDAGADLAPIDLALGWGAMSDNQVIDQLSISQSGRFYFWSWQNQPPISNRQIIQSSSNMHMVPVDDYIANQLKDVRKGDIIQLRGLLIEANKSNGWKWRSSLSRDDTGNGACELFFVKEVSVL